MKQITFVLIFCIAMSNGILAQKISTADLPPAVAESFKTKFSIVEKATWSLDYDNYKAEFQIGKANFSALFDKDGNWLLTEIFLKQSELPKVVKDRILKEFGELSAYKIDDAKKVEAPKKLIVYEMDVEKGELKFHIVVSEKGELMIKEEVKYAK